jgi:type IV secretion system protein VirD4
MIFLHALRDILSVIGHVAWFFLTIGAWWKVAITLATLVLAFRLFGFTWSRYFGRRGIETDRTRTMRHRIRARLRPGPGFASFAELILWWSAYRAALTGKRVRPSLTFRQRLFIVPTSAFAVYLGRAQYGKRVYARAEDQVLILSLPRTGKSGYLASRIITHDGPVIVTSTRLDLFLNTARDRARRGRVHVFNPQGFGDLRSTFAFNPVEGCSDPAVAMRRAESIVGSATAQGEMAFWSGMASTLLAAFMHAADLCGVPMTTVFSWNSRHGDALAQKTLTDNPLASEEMLSALVPAMRPGKTSDSIRTTLAASLSWLAIPSLARAVCPKAGDGFDFDSWANENETVYLIAQDAAGNVVAPLFRCFTTELHFRAKEIGTFQPAGRLDPTALFALDELCQCCDIDAPSWLSDSAGFGVQMIVVAHSLSQLEARYGKFGAATIWGNCGTKVCLPGSSDDDVLDSAEKLAGTVTIKRAGSDMKGQRETVSVMPREVMRMLPDEMALVLRMNRPVTVTRLPMVWDRKGFKALSPAQGISLLTLYGPGRASVLGSRLADVIDLPHREVIDTAEAQRRIDEAYADPDGVVSHGHEGTGHEDQAAETGEHEDGTGTDGD